MQIAKVRRIFLPSKTLKKVLFVLLIDFTEQYESEDKEKFDLS